MADDCLTCDVTREKPFLRPRLPPVSAERLQKLGRGHEIAVLPPFTPLNSNDHPLSVDGDRFQVNGLAGPQASGIAGRQDRPVLDVQNAAEKTHNLRRAEKSRQMLRVLGSRDDIVKVPRPPESRAIQKAKSCNGNLDRTGSQLHMFVRYTWYERISSGPRNSGDFLK